MLLTVDHLSFEREGLSILKDVSFSIEAGGITTILGPNGAGKSTLLRLILGLLKPTKGKITQVPGLKIGYMPQKLKLNQTLPLTVHRFLSLTTNPFWTPQTILEKVRGEKLLDRPLIHLSGGEMQRVMLAKALMAKPTMLILDEPTQALDIQGQLHFYEMIGQLQKTENLTVLLVSHDLYMVMGTSDHVICLNGHICCEGHPEMVQQNAAYQHLFPHGRTFQTIAPYAHHHDHTHGDGCNGLST